MKVKSESEDTQSDPTLSYPMDCSLPGSSVHGIFQTRILEWVAIAFSVAAQKQPIGNEDKTVNSKHNNSVRSNRSGQLNDEGSDRKKMQKQIENLKIGIRVYLLNV